MQTFETTFDAATDAYDKIRPSYVNELYDDIFKYKEIDAESSVLEIGIGTGKATGPILDRKCQLIALEPGANLTAFVKDKFKIYSNFQVHNQMFQEYECPEESFDFIYAATTFHWIPEEYGYKRVYELLKHGGAFARFRYYAGADKTREALTAEIQELYKTYTHSTRSPKEYGEEDAKKLADVAIKYGFADTQYKLYHWRKDFTADEYLQLLSTYPDHMKLKEENRQKLFQGIHAAIQRHGGIHTVHYTMDLQLARKL